MTIPTPAAYSPEHAQDRALHTLIQERITRIDHVTGLAWRALARDSSDPVLSRALSRKALLETNRLARDLRRASKSSSPEPAWVDSARQRLMVARMELGELRHHRTHSSLGR